MKSIKTLIILLALQHAFPATSQETVALGIYQDARLAFTNDKHGNTPVTIDLLARLVMQGNQQAYGFMIVYPEFEYANLFGGRYIRYSVNIGYVFNKLIVKNLEAGLSAGWGYIDRDGTHHSGSVSADLGYKITKHLKGKLILQNTHRTELKTPKIGSSGFFGIEINL